MIDGRQLLMLTWKPCDTTGGKARRLPQPTFVPRIDPREAQTRGWFAATGFEAIPVPSNTTVSSRETIEALEFAAHLTDLARTKAQGATVDALHEAAGLHALAAEIRREAGHWALCAENYEALVLHYHGTNDFKAASAYLRRLLFVGEHANSPLVRIDAYLLATEVRMTFGDYEGARKAAASAARYALEASDFAALARAAAAGARAERAPSIPAENSGRSGPCPCGGELPYAECCEPTDMPPAEFMVRAVGLPVSATRPSSSPWLSGGRDGLGLVMERPGLSGESRYWVSHGVQDGRHFLAALPNWSARAMEAALAMRDYSFTRPNSSDGPSSAVLQVTCALEAFINTTIYFIGRDQFRRWTDSGIPSVRIKAHKRKNSGALHVKWTDVANGMFGKERADKKLLSELKLLTNLRANLCHFKEDAIQWIRTDDLDPADLLSEFEQLEAFRAEGAIRPGPGHWVDRLLTPPLAAWAVRLGEDLIASFRTAWEEGVRSETEWTVLADDANADAA